MATPQQIRILIADDHDMLREGLVAFLKAFDDFVLVAQASDGEETIRQSDLHQPDVILMDLMMPGMDGITAIKAIRQSHPNTQIIVLTSFGEDEFVGEAIEAGAIGYFLKNVRAERLAEAIRAAAAGKPTLSVEATQALIHKTVRPLPVGHDLTQRELQVLTLMVKGSSNAAIAAELSLSPSTVKHHVSSVLSKLGVATRTEAVSLALQSNLVPLQQKGGRR